MYYGSDFLNVGQYAGVSVEMVEDVGLFGRRGYVVSVAKDGLLCLFMVCVFVIETSN